MRGVNACLLAGVLAIGTAGAAQMRQTIPAMTNLPFSAAVKADGLISVAGTLSAEGDIRAQTRWASGTQEGDRVADCTDGDRESTLGLQPDPRRVEEPRPPCRAKHGGQGAER